MRPVPLLYEPVADEPENARFFGLDEITDRKSTRLNSSHRP